ncbi:unnamed protein product, partial [Laminaria digitata]
IKGKNDGVDDASTDNEKANDRGDGEKSETNPAGAVTAAAAVAAAAAAAVAVAEATGRKRRVRLLHVSRPLMGGLLKVPENVGELDMATVDQYAAVLKSYPEAEGIFVEMDDFASDVLSYCSRHLARQQTNRGRDKPADCARGAGDSGGGGDNARTLSTVDG